MISDIQEHESKFRDKNPKSESFLDIQLMKFILTNIKDSIKFAISDKMDSLMENLEDEERTLVGFDNVLKVSKYPTVAYRKG